MEKKIMPMLSVSNKPERGTILDNSFEGKGRLRIAWMLPAIFFLGVTILFAAPGEPRKKVGFKGAMGAEMRGWTNGITALGEIARTLPGEKKDHPKAWPVTYMAKAFANTMTRAGSGVTDILIMPWTVAAGGDPTPITRRFDLPDYVWQKDL